jgi:hypothetical protein
MYDILERIRAIVIEGNSLGELEGVIDEIMDLRQMLDDIEAEVDARIMEAFKKEPLLVKIIGKEIAVTRVYRKVRKLIGDPETMDKSLLEYKLNTKAVNAYEREYGRLPDGVSEEVSESLRKTRTKRGGDNAED